jgi:hypothetical protein
MQLGRALTAEFATIADLRREKGNIGRQAGIVWNVGPETEKRARWGLASQRPQCTDDA